MYTVARTILRTDIPRQLPQALARQLEQLCGVFLVCRVGIQTVHTAVGNDPHSSASAELYPIALSVRLSDRTAVRRNTHSFGIKAALGKAEIRQCRTQLAERVFTEQGKHMNGGKRAVAQLRHTCGQSACLALTAAARTAAVTQDTRTEPMCKPREAGGRCIRKRHRSHTALKNAVRSKEGQNMPQIGASRASATVEQLCADAACTEVYRNIRIPFCPNAIAELGEHILEQEHLLTLSEQTNAEISDAASRSATVIHIAVRTHKCAAVELLRGYAGGNSAAARRRMCAGKLALESALKLATGIKPAAVVDEQLGMPALRSKSVTLGDMEHKIVFKHRSGICRHSGAARAAVVCRAADRGDTEQKCGPKQLA